MYDSFEYMIIIKGILFFSKQKNHFIEDLMVKGNNNFLLTRQDSKIELIENVVEYQLKRRGNYPFPIFDLFHLTIITVGYLLLINYFR
jgi:hypothetical protein